MLPGINSMCLVLRLFLSTFTLFITPTFPDIPHAVHMFHVKLTTTHMQMGKLGLPDLCTGPHAPGIGMAWTPGHGSIPHCLIPTYLCASRTYLNPISNSEHYGAFAWFYSLFLYSQEFLFPLCYYFRVISFSSLQF